MIGIKFKLSKVCAGKEHLYSCNLLSTALGQALVHAPLPLVLQCELPPLYLVQVQCTLNTEGTVYNKYNWYIFYT